MRRGTLLGRGFAAVQRWWIDLHDRVSCFGEGFSLVSECIGEQGDVASFARTWLNELKGRNIRVNVLSPGPIATPMQDQVLDEEAKRAIRIPDPRERGSS